MTSDDELKKQFGKDFHEGGTTTVQRGRPKKNTDLHKTNVDLSPQMLSDLDALAKYMGVGRQSAIKALLAKGLDDHIASRAQAGTKVV